MHIKIIIEARNRLEQICMVSEQTPNAHTKSADTASQHYDMGLSRDSLVLPNNG